MLSMPVILSSEGPASISTVTNALTTALSTAGGDLLGVVAAVIPIVIPVMIAMAAVGIGMRIFHKVTKS